MREKIELIFQLPEGETLYKTEPLLDWFAACIVRSRAQGIDCELRVNGQKVNVEEIVTLEQEPGNA